MPATFPARLFLTPITEKCLKDFATFFYTKDKAKGKKSNPNHVVSSARKLNIVLTAEASVQESQAFTAFCDELTTDLKKNYAHHTKLCPSSSQHDHQCNEDTVPC
jgi:hypothetical protein